MEKYARQALSEGHKTPEELRVAVDSELYRVLNLHYNRNNHIEVSKSDHYRKSPSQNCPFSFPMGDYPDY